MNRSLRTIVATLLVLASLIAPHLHAQDYPNRPIRMVMPFGPGGPTDIVARLLAQHISTRLGQSVIVENRAGANGIIGSEIVARAAPGAAARGMRHRHLARPPAARIGASPVCEAPSR